MSEKSTAARAHVATYTQLAAKTRDPRKSAKYLRMAASWSRILAAYQIIDEMDARSKRAA